VTSTTAPLPEADVERALAPLGEARMLPSAAYTDTDVLAWEREHLFAGEWVCIVSPAPCSTRNGPWRWEWAAR